MDVISLQVRPHGGDDPPMQRTQQHRVADRIAPAAVFADAVRAVVLVHDGDDIDVAPDIADAAPVAAAEPGRFHPLVLVQNLAQALGQGPLGLGGRTHAP